MIDRLKNLGVEVQAIEQPLDLSVPENLMILSVYLALPDIDNKRRSIKITEGVRAAKMAGRWLGAAPYGYKNARDESNKPVIVPGDKAKVVKKIFNLISKGKTQAEVKEHFKKQGITFAKTTFSEMLRNQVYIGNIWVQSETGGYYVRGLHEPLIDEATFQKVQEQLEGHLTKKNFTKVKSFQPELHLRGLLLCDNCGGHLTGSASRGRNGAKHHYYHCNNCGSVRVKAAVTHEKVEAILSEFQVRTSTIKLYEKVVAKLLKGEEKKKRPQSKIKEEIAQYQKRLGNMEDDFADRLIDLDTFQKSKARYGREIEKLKCELEESNGSEPSIQKLVKKGIHAMQQLPHFYQNSSIEVKREVLGSIFPEKLQIGEKKC